MFRRKLPSGRVQYGEWYTDPLTDQRKRITVTLTPTGHKKVDDRTAQDALSAKIRDVFEASGQVGSITLKALQERYVEHQARHFKPQTADNDRKHLNTLIRLLGEDTLADRLTAPYVADRLDAEPVTYNERLKRFKAWMRWAYRMDLVEDIRYIDKLIPKKTDSVRVKNAQKYLEHEEITKLLDGMTVERWRLLTEFLILSGLRIGEAIALEDSDVDDVIHVTKTYSPTLRQISTTKTATSTRDVDVQPELADCIYRIRRFVKREELKFGYRSDLFLPAFGGGYITYDVYGKYFRENTEAILGRRLSPHSLRHTHTAMLAEAGVPLETISRRLGHSDSKITREVYMHVTKGMKKRDRERLEKVHIL
ncbi:MAG: tyrosine-type recombinase/integrase [Lachnospiraceae bacterium]|nr:tyrosine-type recombinase/integrase [Lachnospiraceae bacterium]